MMKYPLHIVALTLSLTCISQARAQTVDDSSAKLAEALTHRREEVRQNAFSALLEKATAGEDVSDARPELLRFANLEHRDRFEPEELFKYQAEALKVLVVIDEQVAEKLLARSSLLADAVIALDKQDSSTAHKATQHLRSALDLMAYLRKPEHVQQAAELAERLSPLMMQYDYAALLPVIYPKYPSGGERIEITERLLQPRFKDRTAWDSRVEDCVFAGLYTARLDEESLTFLTTLDSDYSKAQHRANMLGLLSKRSNKAKQAAIEIMNDEYENIVLRQYAASGLMAVHSPDEELYWQADAVLELQNGYYRELFDFAPKFNETEHRQLRKNRKTEQQAPQEIPQGNSGPESIRTRPEKTPAAEQLRMTQEDSRELVITMTEFQRQAKSMTVNGSGFVQIPRSAFEKIRQAQRQAHSDGRQALAQTYERFLQAWDTQIELGRLKILD